MAEKDDEPQLVEISNLTDADWAEINKLRQAYARGGRDGFEKAFDDLYKRNDIHWMKIAFAYYPTTIREALKRD